MKKISKKAQNFAEDLKNFFKSDKVSQTDKDEIFKEFLKHYDTWKKINKN